MKEQAKGLVHARQGITMNPYNPFLLLFISISCSDWPFPHSAVYTGLELTILLSLIASYWNYKPIPAPGGLYLILKC